MLKKWIKYCICSFAVICISKADAQVSLTGPVCVLPGLVYQYEISNKGTDTTNMRLCVTGGVIAGTTTTCTSTGNLSYIRVNWTDSIGGQILLTTSMDSASISVSVTNILSAGLIDSSSKVQTAVVDSIPPPIHCSAATGGSCDPQYAYQWEQSADGVTWQSIADAASADLIFTSPINQTTYYRRRVSETNGNSEALSEVALIIVQ